MALFGMGLAWVLSAGLFYAGLLICQNQNLWDLAERKGYPIARKWWQICYQRRWDRVYSILRWMLESEGSEISVRSSAPSWMPTMGRRDHGAAHRSEEHTSELQ